MRVVRYGLGLVLAFVLPWGASLAVAADVPQNVYGAWVLKAGTRNLFVLTLKPGATAGLPIIGDYVRPSSLAKTGNTYFNIQMPNLHWRIVDSAFFDGQLHFTTTDPKQPGKNDTYTFRLLSVDAASLSHDGGSGSSAPLYLSRGGADVVAADDWDKDTKYASANTVADIPAIRLLYDADQSDRTAGNPDKVDWKVVQPRDVSRREAARKLLEDGALKSGDDYEEAAFIFQHSDNPSDYLLAHTLALIATTKGDKRAAWIAAATLDRYLLKIGQPQIYGTQFGEDGQTRLDRTIVSDKLREELNVPPLEQEKQH